MKFIRLRQTLGAASTLLASALMAPASHAQNISPAALLRTHAEAGTLAEGEKLLAARVAANAGDAEARAALGFAKFARAVEKLGQSLHRHGLRPPPNMGMMLPVLRFPVPENPNPEPISYQKMRAIYAALLGDMAEVETVLAAVPASDFKLRLDLSAVRLDLNADGKGAPQESLGAVVRELMQPRSRRDRLPPMPEAIPAWNIAFDYADTIWLRGYAKLLSAFSEFALAHDWSDAFATTAQLFFPNVEGAVGIAAISRPDPSMGGVEANSIADAIAFLHMVRFPVVEPARMPRVRQHLLEMVKLSRENWKAILAESDDEDEWLPSPRQKNSAVLGVSVTDEIVGNWHAALAQFEAALEGKVLLGHWRFQKGIDLKQVFEEPRTFDLVLWILGPAALPYLKDGETLSRSTVNEWQRMFGGNFLSFAIWFN